MSRVILLLRSGVRTVEDDDGSGVGSAEDGGCKLPRFRSDSSASDNARKSSSSLPGACCDQ